MQSQRLAIALGGDDPPHASICRDRRICPHICVAPCNKARSATLYDAMGAEPPVLKAQNDISYRYVGSSCALHIEHIANAERRKHAVASNTGPHSSLCSENLQKQLILCFLNTVSTHRGILVHSSAIKQFLARCAILSEAGALLTLNGHFRFSPMALSGCTLSRKPPYFLVMKFFGQLCESVLNAKTCLEA